MAHPEEIVQIHATEDAIVDPKRQRSVLRQFSQEKEMRLGP